MHEMGMANSVLEAVRAEARRFPNGKIREVGVRIGELAGVDPEAMRFCFEVLVQGTDLDPLALRIEFCPRRHQCVGCGRTFQAGTDDAPCPQCHELGAVFVGGDELELAYLEVDDGASAAGA